MAERGGGGERGGFGRGFGGGRPRGNRRAHKVSRADLPPLAPNQGAPDRRQALPRTQGRGHEDHARTETDTCWTAHT
uniref:Uncharacterized protein n=1 Tax=Fagus sylvatica TaxID=28930 RepID=A0A2N9HN91_FAGSY